MPIRLVFYLNIFIILLFLRCTTDNAINERDSTEVSPVADSANGIHVSTVIAKKKKFYYLINSNGKILPSREEIVLSEVNGKVIRCNAKDGLIVSSGEIIAQLETTATMFKMERAMMNKYNSEKEFQSQLLGYENLINTKSATEANEIRQKLKISTGLSGAEQDIKEANYELSKSSIKATFSGVVANVTIQDGQFIKSGQELFRIYDPKSLLLSVKILETDISYLKVGTLAEINSLTLRNKMFVAHVIEINPYVDAFGMISVKLLIENDINKQNRTQLFPGMNCTATIKVPLGTNIIVPKEALINKGNKNVVFTVTGNKAQWNYVTIGRDNGKEVEILEGLKEGEKVIITNNLQLSHNALIKELNNQNAIEELSKD